MGTDGKVTGTKTRALHKLEVEPTISPDKSGAAIVKWFWNVSGVKKEVGACTFCSFSVAFQARVDYEKSTCPGALSTTAPIVPDITISMSK